jgi:hypothetical protein
MHLPADQAAVEVIQDKQIKVLQEADLVFPDRDSVAVMVQEHLVIALRTQVVVVVVQEPKAVT